MEIDVKILAEFNQELLDMAAEEDNKADEANPAVRERDRNEKPAWWMYGPEDCIYHRSRANAFRDAAVGLASAIARAGGGGGRQPADRLRKDGTIDAQPWVP